jgi:hypothetical protein
MAKIASNTGNLFSLANVKVSEVKSENEEDTYISYQVKISSIKGTYKQLKKLIHYIDEYESKIKIDQITFKRDIDEIDGSMTLIFYSTPEEGEETWEE